MHLHATREGSSAIEVSLEIPTDLSGTHPSERQFSRRRAGCCRCQSREQRRRQRQWVVRRGATFIPHDEDRQTL